LKQYILKEEKKKEEKSIWFDMKASGIQNGL
jgi:hypothetical protein